MSQRHWLFIFETATYMGTIEDRDLLFILAQAPDRISRLFISNVSAPPRVDCCVAARRRHPAAPCPTTRWCRLPLLHTPLSPGPRQHASWSRGAFSVVVTSFTKSLVRAGPPASAVLTSLLLGWLYLLSKDEEKKAKLYFSFPPFLPLPCPKA